MVQLLTILVLGAMDVETDYLISRLVSPKKTTVGCWQFYESESYKGNDEEFYNNKRIIVCRLNIGMNNAAGAAATGILKFNPDIIISEGTAGGHDPILHRGDIIIGEKCLNMACMLSEKTGKGGGINAATWDIMDWNLFDEDSGDSVGKESSSAEQSEKEKLIPYLYSDNDLVEKALDFGKKKEIFAKYGEIRKGTLASSDNWNRELDRINLFVERYGTSAEEMESFAITQIAHNFKKKVLSIRIISNSEQHDGEYYDRNTGTKCQEFVFDFINSL